MTSPEASTAYPLLRGAYQLAYVVQDIEVTVARLRAFGVERIDVRRNLAIPRASGTILHSAKAWVGALMLEIIEPVRDRPSLYDEPPPEGANAFLHHIGCDVVGEADWDALTASLESRALEVATLRTLPGLLSFAYTDLRGEIGLFLEHVRLLDPGFYDQVPSNPPAQTGPRPLLDHIFQVAFVTADLSVARALFGERFGIPRWSLLDYPEDGPLRRVALAWTGELMIELIEPNPAVASIYAEGLQDGRTASLHHIAARVRDAAEFARVEEALAGCGVPLVSRKETAGLRSLMADTRRDLGHFIEFVEVRAPGQEQFDVILRGG